MDDDSSKQIAVITRSQEAQVLLVESMGGGWALPSVSGEGPPEVRAELRAMLGLDVEVLGVIGDVPGIGEPVPLLAVECISPPDAIPARARWMGGRELASIPLVGEGQRSPVIRWLEELAAAATPPLRAPWLRPGWRAEVGAWIEAELERLGLRREGALQQITAQPWSSVARVPLAGGAQCYFKATTPAFEYEVKVTAALASVAPDALPRVLALDDLRGWMLLADAGSGIRARVLTTHDMALWQRALRAYARLQRASAAHVAVLAATGCPDRRLERIPALYADLIGDLGALRAGTPEDVTDGELDELRAFAPQVARLCDALATYGLPMTIHHDDLGPGNMHSSPTEGAAGTFRVLDWGEAALAHPFCSLMIPLRWASLVTACPTAEIADLRDAYLAEWTAYGSLARLRTAAAMAVRLGYLSRALTWRTFVSGIEPAIRRPYLDAPAYWLKLFLRDGRE